MNSIPVYDATGICYYHGVTNFTADNVYAALRSIGEVNRKNIKILLAVTVYDSLDASDQIYHSHKDDSMQWRQFDVDIDPNSDTNSTVVDSLITTPTGKQVILKTREY